MTQNHMRYRSTSLVCIIFLSVLVCTNVRATPLPPQNLPVVMITGLHYFGYEGSADEAVRLTATGDNSTVLDNSWRLRDDAGHSYGFASPITIAPGASVWLANSPLAFERQFGFSPTQSYGGQLGFANAGGTVQLTSQTSVLLDTANGDGGMWNGGSGSPLYISMERKDSGAPDTPANWGTAVGSLAGVLDLNNATITGTPRALNSIAVSPTVPTSLTVVINEVAWAGIAGSPSHEWLELYNNANNSIGLSGWRIEISNGNVIPLTGTIAAHGYYLIQRSPGTFNSGPVADLVYSFVLLNTGATLRLVDARESVVDTLVYGDNLSATEGWLGAPAIPYSVSHSIVADGQVLLRKLPLRDSDAAEDWIGASDDVIEGRRVAFPGWQLELFNEPVRAASHITVAVAPDGSFEALRTFINSARTSIDVETYSFESVAIAELLYSRMMSGVRVRVLLDGTPTGGLPEQTKWACARISQVPSLPDSGCWFMRSDGTHNIHRRFNSFHAKFVIVDDAQLSVASENFSPNGFPDDDKRDGTAGQRGLIAFLDSPALVARAREIWNADAAYPDMVRFGVDANWSGPASGFVPVTVTGGISYTVRFTQPLLLRSLVTVELSTSPESNLRVTTGLLPLLRSLGPGDSVYSEQLEEPYFWGGASGDPVHDPNPRLQAALTAAQNGAQAWLIFDSFYARQSDLRSNFATLRFLRDVRAQTNWNINVAMGNPTAHGIHNKAWLVNRQGTGYSQIGSWNGSEASSKVNREMSVLIESTEVFEYLKHVFENDWRWSNPMQLPTVMSSYTAPAGHMLISEVMFDPIGLDDGREWIELYNPTPTMIELTGYKIGDAETRGRSTADGMFQFPNGTQLASGGVLVVAQNALQFEADYQHPPNFEIAEYDPLVPNLSPYLPWSNGVISLNNLGDQVILLGPDDAIVDAVQWGNSTALVSPIAFTHPMSSGHSLQRWPPNADTHNSAVDFRDQIAPSVGRVP